MPSYAISLLLVLTATQAFGTPPSGACAKARSVEWRGHALSDHLEVLSQLKEEDVEAMYSAALPQWAQRTETLSTAYGNSERLWLDVADRAGQRALVAPIESKGREFQAAIAAAKSEPLNSKVERVGMLGKDLGNHFSEVYRKLNNTAQGRDRAKELNESTAALGSAIKNFNLYWNQTLKPLSDKRQVIELIRAKVEETMRPAAEATAKRIAEHKEARKNKLSSLQVMPGKLALQGGGFEKYWIDQLISAGLLRPGSSKRRP